MTLRSTSLSQHVSEADPGGGGGGGGVAIPAMRS